MNRVVAGLSALVIGVSGLVFVSPAASASSTQSAVTVVSAKVTKNDRAFLKSVRSDALWLGAVGNATLIKAGKTTCRTLKSGATAYDVIDAGIEDGLDDEDIVALISNAVVYYCPAQAYKFAE